MIKSNFITSCFQRLLKDNDIRTFKNSFFYYVFFRLFRNFLNNQIIIKIFNFKILGSINRNNTSYFLLKKCEFGDDNELNFIKEINKSKKILFLDCGCNYGFYSLYVASLSTKNKVVSIEASKKTLNYFKKNIKLNKLTNIVFYNKAISNKNNVNVIFNESDKDWESSVARNDLVNKKKINIKTIKIDKILSKYDLNKFYPIIKLDIEGDELNALKGCLNSIRKKSPIIIIEFSKYTLDSKDKIDFLDFFLKKYNYSIYDTNYKKFTVKEIMRKMSKLNKRFMTIGNFYLLKNSSRIFKPYFK